MAFALTRDTEKTPTSVIAMALKGKASRSSTSSLIAAVPRPWLAAPIASPRATGSLTPNFVKIVVATFAPSSPVKTTNDTAMPTSAPSIFAMAMASGLVMFRLSVASLSSIVLNLTAFASQAVLNMDTKDDPMHPTAHCNRFCFIRLRRSYICELRAITAGPRKKRRTSPAPNAEGVMDFTV